jgi:hypothetical protein
VTSTSADVVAEHLAGIPGVDLFLGVFAGAADSLAQVNIDDRQLTVPALGNSWPMIGDRVRLLRVGKATIMLGSVQQRATVGRVTAPGSPRCTVEYPAGSGVTQLMGYPKGATPEVGDVVLISWDGEAGGTVTAIVTAAGGQDGPIPEPPTPPQQTDFQSVFTMSDSGSFRDGSWWTNQVYASPSNQSAYFPGSGKIADTIPDDATIDSIAIWLPVNRDTGNRPRIGTHSYQTKPGGPPTISNLTDLGTQSGWVQLPTSYGDLLKTGEQSGIGFDGAGFAIFAGTQQDGQAGALDIAWHL